MAYNRDVLHRSNNRWSQNTNVDRSTVWPIIGENGMSDITNEAQAVAKDNIDRTMSGLKDGVSAATAGMEQAQASVRDGLQKVMRSAEDMIAFTQGNVEAITRSGQILATGLQDIGQGIAATARASADDATNTFKALAAVKSIKEALDLQSSLFRSMIERAVSQTSQMTDSTMKLSEQAMAPITARLSLASEKFGRIG